MKRVILLVILALNSVSILAYSNLTEHQAAQRAIQIGEVKYQLSLSLDKSSDTFSGINVTTFELLDNTQDVVFDFYGKLVKSVIINGKQTSDFTFDLSDENITLPKQWLQKGQNIVSIAYEAHFSNNGTGLHQFTDPKDQKQYFYSNFETANAHRMFPHFDQPDIKAVFTLDVDAPADWHLISNMPVSKSTKSPNRKRDYFQATLKISSYIMHLSAGPYAMWQDNSGKYPMRVYGRQSLAEYIDAKAIFETTKKGIVFFEDYYGFDYPFSKYDHIFVPEFNAGAMENAGAVTLAEYMVFKTPPNKVELVERDVTILHEMAHMWFGDLVTMKWWNDLWLNESFAEFMGYLGLEGIGVENAWDSASLGRNWAYKEDQQVTTHPILVDVPDIQSAFAIFDSITYSKGLAVLKQLEYTIGPEVFKEGIRQYFQKYAYKNTTLNDFIGTLEAVHGQKLTPWVDSWLATKDVNSMKLAYAVKDNKIVGAKVYQTGGRQDDTLRRHANLIGLYYPEQGRLTLKETVKVTFEGDVSQLAQLNGKPVPAVILPNIGDYDYVKIRLDANSLAWLKTNMTQVKDTATKLMVWRTLWDMVRDQELKASDYFDMAIERIADETDAQVLDMLLTNLEQVAAQYTTVQTVKDAYLARFHLIAADKVYTSKKGADVQRLWYWALRVSVNNEQQLNALIDLYDAKVVIDGVMMTHRRKWRILRTLALFNKKAAIEKRLPALLASDTSAMGKNMQLSVETTFPDKAVKAQAWDKIASQSGHSLRQKRAIATAMYNSRHPQLAKPYIDKYFQAIEVMDKKGEQYELISLFIERLFPYLGLEETVIATQHFLNTSTVSKTYKTLVLKELDRLQRTIAIRKFTE